MSTLFWPKGGPKKKGKILWSCKKERNLCPENTIHSSKGTGLFLNSQKWVKKGGHERKGRGFAINKKIRTKRKKTQGGEKLTKKKTSRGSRSREFYGVSISISKVSQERGVKRKTSKKNTD